jgi:hypothetical protein
MSTKSEELYQRVVELMEGGASQADACRQVAEERGLQPNSVRGTYQTMRRKASGSTPTPRRRSTTPADAIADAIKTLERAKDNIDRETQAAEARAREFAEEAKELKATAADRKAGIQAKIDALS